MGETSDGMIRVCTLDELKARGKMVVSGARCPILVVYHDGKVEALDNRCPHLGFPLHRGSIEDGILTCHWHHARFDLASGATFDLWADDVPRCRVEVRDGEVWVEPEAQYADEAAHWRRRLGDGMAHNLGLVIAKSVLGLKKAGVDEKELVREAALFGAQNRDGWGAGHRAAPAAAGGREPRVLTLRRAAAGPWQPPLPLPGRRGRLSQSHCAGHRQARKSPAGAGQVGKWQPCFVFELLAVCAPPGDIDSGGNDNRGHKEETRGQSEEIERSKEQEPHKSRTGAVGLHVAFHTKSSSKPCAVRVRGL